MQLYEEKKQKPHNPKRYNTPFLLRDILCCQHCHQLMKTKISHARKMGKYMVEDGITVILLTVIISLAWKKFMRN